MLFLCFHNSPITIHTHMHIWLTTSLCSIILNWEKCISAPGVPSMSCTPTHNILTKQAKLLDMYKRGETLFPLTTHITNTVFHNYPLFHQVNFRYYLILQHSPSNKMSWWLCLIPPRLIHSNTFNLPFTFQHCKLIETVNFVDSLSLQTTSPLFLHLSFSFPTTLSVVAPVPFTIQTNTFSILSSTSIQDYYFILHLASAWFPCKNKLGFSCRSLLLF